MSASIGGRAPPSPPSCWVCCSSGCGPIPCSTSRKQRATACTPSKRALQPRLRSHRGGGGGPANDEASGDDFPAVRHPRPRGERAHARCRARRGAGLHYVRHAAAGETAPRRGGTRQSPVRKEARARHRRGNRRRRRQRSRRRRASHPRALFPHHHPDPTVLENLHDLQIAVKEEKAELGIAFDGDGDRIGAVDETGEPVLGDQLLVLFGRDLVRRMGKGKPVIFDVKCSEILPQMLKRAGLEPVMWKTGHSFIKQKMKEIGAPLAGEMSGHMFFGGDWYGFDDALFAAARLLAYVAREGGPLSRLLADLPKTYATPEIRVDCPDEQKFDVVQQAAAEFAAKYPVSTLDGVRITFPEGWGLLRASNTQPVLVMRFEATSPNALDAYRAEVEGWLAARGVTA